ncbi:uncharacterized protein LOC144124504 [Amblyomma americanum]
MAAFKKTADPTASSCFFTRRLKSRFYLVVQSERITIIEASEGHGPPERSLHETSGLKIDEDNLSRGDERGASASCRQDTRSPTDPTPVPSPQPSQQHTPEPPLQPSTCATPSLLEKRQRDDGANKVLRQMLYESHRLDSLTDARNRQDAAFQQSMLEVCTRCALCTLKSRSRHLKHNYQCSLLSTSTSVLAPLVGGSWDS